MTLTEDRPIFQQIAEQLEEAILSGAYPEESQVPSITEYSVQYRINPATALKGHKITKQLSKKSLAKRYLREKGIKDEVKTNLLIETLKKAESC